MWEALSERRPAAPMKTTIVDHDFQIAVRTVNACVHPTLSLHFDFPLLTLTPSGQSGLGERQLKDLWLLPFRGIRNELASKPGLRVPVVLKTQTGEHLAVSIGDLLRSVTRRDE